MDNTDVNLFILRERVLITFSSVGCREPASGLEAEQREATEQAGVGMEVSMRGRCTNMSSCSRWQEAPGLCPT